MLTSRPTHAEDFGLSEDPCVDNAPMLQAAIDDARAGSRRMALPPGEFRVGASLLCSGVDIEGTQGGNGTRLVLTSENVPLLRFTGRAPDGSFDVRGSVRDLLMFSDGIEGFYAIDARGDAEQQPSHLRIERVRISGLNGGTWHVPIVINGLDRTTGAIGNRGAHLEEVQIFRATNNFIVLRGLNDAQLIGVNCYLGGVGSNAAFWLGGSSAVYNENICAYGCSAQHFYAEYTRHSRVMGHFGSITTDAATTPGLIVSA